MSYDAIDAANAHMIRTLATKRAEASHALNAARDNVLTDDEITRAAATITGDVLVKWLGILDQHVPQASEAESFNARFVGAIQETLYQALRHHLFAIDCAVLDRELD